ncbi:MAG: YciI family protein [Halioglobus sp.]
MYYIVVCRDKEGTLKTREAVRQEHRQYLREKHVVRVVQGGPTLDDDLNMNGTALVVEAANKGQVGEFLAGDPYSKADIFARVDILSWQAVDITCGEEI